MIKTGIEREIRFDKNLRKERQANYNISDYELINYMFPTGPRKVYKNFNFSIFLDDYCNADCKFCIAQIRYQHKNEMYNKPHIADTNMYLKRLWQVLHIIRPLNPSVSITGGEPTLSPILTDVLEMVDSFGFRKRTITSNGSGLFNMQNGNTIIENLVKYNVDHLNISRVSYRDDINHNIMKFDNAKEYCDMGMLREALSGIKNTTLHHRLSCLLLKESVNSKYEIKKYIDFYNKLGANNFIFRQLMDYDKSAKNTEKMDYCNANKVDLNDIWSEFDHDIEFIPYLNLLGYYYYVELYKYHDLMIASESANLNQQYAEKSRNADVIYEMAFHNNGNLCGSWIDTEDVLDIYDSNEYKYKWRNLKCSKI